MVKKMTMRRSFGKTLEDKAEELSASLPQKQWDNSIPGMLRREIGLTVDQIRRLKERHDEQFHRLLKLECSIDTDLMQLNQHLPWYASHPFPERDTFKQRLFDIEKERRNLSLRLEEKTQNLETRLLELINRHEQLDI